MSKRHSVNSSRRIAAKCAATVGMIADYLEAYREVGGDVSVQRVTEWLLKAEQAVMVGANADGVDQTLAGCAAIIEQAKRWPDHLARTEHMSDLNARATLLVLIGAARTAEQALRDLLLTDDLGAPDAYRPAKECIDGERFITAASVTKYLNAHPDIRTKPVLTQNGKPHPRRRLVHMGDWHRTIGAESVIDSLNLNADTVDAMVRSVEQRKDKAHAEKVKKRAPATSPLLSFAKKIAGK